MQKGVGSNSTAGLPGQKFMLQKIPLLYPNLTTSAVRERRLAVVLTGNKVRVNETVAIITPPMDETNLKALWDLEKSDQILENRIQGMLLPI